MRLCERWQFVAMLALTPEQIKAREEEKTPATKSRQEAARITALQAQRLV
jgi:hypothetical protein